MLQNPHHSRYTLYTKNPCIPPKISQVPPFRQITRNSPTISLFGPREMETSNITANCTKFA